MKYVSGFLLCFFLCLNAISAQKMSLGLQTGSYFSVGTERIELSPSTGIELPNLKSSTVVGIRYGYLLNKHVELNAGVRWHRQRFTGQCYCYFCDKVAVEITDNHNRLEIPIGIKTFILSQEKRLAPFIASGISTQFSKFGDTEFGPKLNVNLGVGIQYNINERWAVQGEASWLREIKTRNYIADYRSYPYALTQELFWTLEVSRRF